MRLDTRTILIALAIINVIAIGLSEVQRRALVEHSRTSQVEFRGEAAEWSKQQADALKKVAAELAVLTARVNRIEIEMASGEATKNTAAQLAGIMARVNKVEIALASGDAAKNTAAQLDGIMARVNKVEIQTAETAAANKQIQDIYNRVQDIETTLRASK